MKRIMAGVGAVVLMAATAALPASASALPHAPLGFGAVTVGASSPTRSADVPLARTVGEIRPLLQTALANVPYTGISVAPFGTVVSAEQVKQVVLDALADLDDSTVLGYRIDTLALESGTDFTISGDCIGADGAVVTDCTVHGVFRPTTIGARTDAANVNVTMTVGFPAMVNALQTALQSDLGFLGAVLAQEVFMPISQLANHALNVALGEVLSPVVELSGSGQPLVRCTDTGGKTKLDPPVTEAVTKVTATVKRSMTSCTGGVTSAKVKVALTTKTAVCSDFVDGSATGTGTETITWRPVATGEPKTSTATVTLSGDGNAKSTLAGTITKGRFAGKQIKTEVTTTAIFKKRGVPCSAKDALKKSTDVATGPVTIS